MMIDNPDGRKNGRVMCAGFYLFIYERSDAESACNNRAFLAVHGRFQVVCPVNIRIRGLSEERMDSRSIAPGVRKKDRKGGTVYAGALEAFFSCFRDKRAA